MTKITSFESQFVSMPVDNIDTDQIIPARFLKTISKAGLGDQLFNDWRYEADGSPKEGFILNQPASKQRHILLAGDNFGCGSSREHAPWALTQYGFRAVISTSFADIFKGNSLKNGLLPIVVNRDVHGWLFENPDSILRIDLATQSLHVASGVAYEFEVDPFMKHCLLEGVDELGYILAQTAAISTFESTRTGSVNTLS
jgi:3-isopropylmalate/(R)-2-methylmalate dehydratase small subunit